MEVRTLTWRSFRAAILESTGRGGGCVDRVQTIPHLMYRSLFTIYKPFSHSSILVE